MSSPQSRPAREMRKKSLEYVDFSVFKQDPTIFKDISSWALPQLIAVLGSNLPLAKNESGKFSFLETFKLIREKIDNETLLLANTLVTRDWFEGVITVLKYSPRGDILPSKAKQSSPEFIRYCAAVPLFLSAFKQYRNINYSEWDWTEEHKALFLEKDILEFSQYFNTEIPYTREELLELREAALKPDSRGYKRTAESTAAVNNVRELNPEFNKLPRLMKLALTQLWVYSPSIRTSFMIADPNNLDALPEPLVSAQIPVKQDFWSL